MPQSDISTSQARIEPETDLPATLAEPCAPVEETDGEGPEQAREPVSSPQAGLWVACSAGLSLLLVALLLLGGHDLLRIRSTDQEQSRQNAAVAAVRQEVLNLTNLDYRRATPDVDAILALATGSFQQQFSSTQAGFRTVLMSGQVVSKGQITETGVASESPGSVRVLVAARAVISNTSAANEARVYRIAVTAIPSQGRWFISDMDFIS